MAVERKPKIGIYRDDEDQWRWRFNGKGGRILADSGQGYADRRSCIRGLELVTGGAVEITYGKGQSYQQGFLTRWDGAGYGEQHAVEIFVQVLG